jgi:hypothetical protein
VTPSVIQVSLKAYRSRFRYRQAKIVLTTAMYAMAEARGFSQLRRLEKKEW